MPVAPRGYIEEDDPRVSQIGHPSPPWMVSYADLMTELVCFFVILYALGAALDRETQEAVKIVKQSVEAESAIGVDTKFDKEGARIELQEDAGIGESSGGGTVQAEKKKSFLFGSGRAELTPELKKVLDLIAPTLRDLNEKREIVVEGHTDDVPLRPGGQFIDNLELSTSRASNVVRYLVGNHGFKPANVAAIGYGEHHPKMPNSDDRNRQVNRRIVFFIKMAKPYSPPWLRGKAGGKEAQGGGPPVEESIPGIEVIEAEP